MAEVKPRRVWNLLATDNLRERATKISEIALCAVADNEAKVSIVLPSATLRVLEALEKYQELDTHAQRRASDVSEPVTAKQQE